MKRLGLFILFTLLFLSYEVIGQRDYSVEFEKYIKSRDIDEKIALLYSFHYKLGELTKDSAFYYIKDIHYEGIKHRRRDAIALSNYVLAHYFIKYSYYKEAEEKLEKAKKYYKNAENDTMLVLTHNLLGNAYYSQGNLNSSKIEYEKAIYYGKKTGLERFEIMPIINLARIAINNKEYDLGEELMDRYIRFQTSPKGEIRDLASGYGLLGELHLSQGNYKEANDNFIRSMEYGLTIGGLSTIANAYTNLGIAEFYAENLKRSGEYFKLALGVRIEDGNPLYIAEAYYNLGDYFIGLMKRDSALANYQRCVEIGDEFGVLGVKKDALEQMASVHEELGNKNEHIAILKQIIETQNEISSKQKSDDNMLMSFNYEQTMMELEGLNEVREEDLEGRVRNYQSIFNNWLLISVFGFLFLGIIYYILKRKKNKSEA